MEVKSASLRASIAANYASQLYVTALGIVMLPLYLRYMGAEAYGLVGFHAMLQVWFGLLDMGLTPTVARQTAVYCAGELSPNDYRHVVRWLEYWFAAIAITGALLLLAGASYIASSWLEGQSVSIADRESAIQLMAFIIALRWIGGVYRGVVAGFERLVWLSGFSAVFATLRFGGVVAAMAIFGGSLHVFFIYQLAVSLAEAVCIATKAYQLLPKASHEGFRASLRISSALSSSLRFSLVIAFTSSVWVVVSQIDKLVLSGILPLAEYAHFTLAVLVASGVNMISVPVSSAIMPRLARLHADGDEATLLHVYRQTTQLVAIVAGSLSVTLAFSAEPLLRQWTGDAVFASEAAPILQLYAIGNGVLAVSAFPYYLQYAKGNLRLHLIGNLLFVVLLVPAIIWVATQYGGIGAGYVWVAANFVNYVAWLPIVHRRFAPGLNAKWYAQDTLVVGAAALLGGYVGSYLCRGLTGAGIWQLIELATVGALAMTFAIVASSAARQRIRARLSPGSSLP
jgi:O-antigen/teichoic acid export membrane protein